MNSSIADISYRKPITLCSTRHDTSPLTFSCLIASKHCSLFVFFCRIGYSICLTRMGKVSALCPAIWNTLGS